MARTKAKEKKECIIQGCSNKTTNSRRVRLIENVDYEIPVSLCSRHKNYFKGHPLLALDLKGLGKEALLGGGNDSNKQAEVKETLDYMRSQAKAADRELSMDLLIDGARHFAKAGDTKFLYGFYFGELYGLSSFKGSFDKDGSRFRKPEQIRSQMALKELYPERKHPHTSNEMVEVCRCGHERIMHDSGEPRGACYMCLCPRYEFEQKLTRMEASDLQLLIHREHR